MNKFRKEDGITLIALVITIIVLLILAGVAISMLAGDNGILRQAASAKKNTDEQSTIEQIKLAATAAITNEEHKIKNLQEELDKQFGVGKATATPIDGGYKVTVNNITQIISESGTVRNETEVEKNVGKEITGNKVTLTDGNGEKIVVPARFTIKEGAATQVKDGIVVVAPDESEFIWVPVDDPSTMYGILEDETLAGKLYNKGDISSKNNWTETDGKMSWTKSGGNREPVLLSKDKESQYYNDLLGYDSSEDFGQYMRSEFNKMIKSIKDNKGFYVARYECSLTEDKTKIQSKPNVVSATSAIDSCNTWYGLYKENKEYSKKNELTDVIESSMIWGCQYDQMLIWMEKNKKGVATSKIGNNRNLGKDNNGTAVGTTGTADKDVINNIYDLYGNASEWTLEASYSNYRVPRRKFVYK